MSVRSKAPEMTVTPSFRGRVVDARRSDLPDSDLLVLVSRGDLDALQGGVHIVAAVHRFEGQGIVLSVFRGKHLWARGQGGRAERGQHHSQDRHVQALFMLHAPFHAGRDSRDTRVALNHRGVDVYRPTSRRGSRFRVASGQMELIRLRIGRRTEP